MYQTDKKRNIGQITNAIVIDILSSEFIIADISNFNPNVLYELGYAHTLGKPSIILCKEGVKSIRLPFDLKQTIAIPYSLQKINQIANRKRLKQELRKRLMASESHLNPISTGLSSNKIKLFKSDFSWLWGLERTFTEAANAYETWVMYNDVNYWEQYFSISWQTVSNKIKTKTCRIFMLLPASVDIMKRASIFQSKLSKVDSEYDQYLKMMFVKNDEMFGFLINGFCIYDPNTTRMRGILLEPMTSTISSDEADSEIESNMLQNKSNFLSNLKESYFDIELPKKILGKMSDQFSIIWNKYANLQGKNDDWIIS